MNYAEGAVDPFAPGARELSPETPALSEVIAEALHQHSLALRVALPASVARVRGNQLVDIQPLLMARYANGKTALPPVVPNALLCAPLGANYGLKLPVAVGDTGLALFCDRSLDTWTAGSGAAADPADSRSHDITDAVFFPGLLTASGQTQDTTSNLTMRNGDAVMTLRQSGTVAFGNGTQELVDLTRQLADALSGLCRVLATQALTLTALGPQPFLASTIGALQAQQQLAINILNNLETLKGES